MLRLCPPLLLINLCLFSIPSQAIIPRQTIALANQTDIPPFPLSPPPPVSSQSPCWTTQTSTSTIWINATTLTITTTPYPNTTACYNSSCTSTVTVTAGPPQTLNLTELSTTTVSTTIQPPPPPLCSPSSNGTLSGEGVLSNCTASAANVSVTVIAPSTSIPTAATARKRGAVDTVSFITAIPTKNPPPASLDSQECGVWSTTTETAQVTFAFQTFIATSTNPVFLTPLFASQVSTVTVAPFTLTQISQIVLTSTTVVKSPPPKSPAPTPDSLLAITPSGNTAPPNGVSSTKKTPASTQAQKQSSHLSPTPLMSPVQHPPGAPAITVGSSVIIASSSVFVIGSSTLSPGGPAITVSGTVFSLAPSGTQLVVLPVATHAGDASPLPSTINLTPVAIAATTPGPSPFIATLGFETLSISSGASLIVLSLSGTAIATLVPSGPSVILPGGTTAFLEPNPTASGGAPVLILGAGPTSSSVFFPPAESTASSHSITGTGDIPATIVPPQPIVTDGITLVPGVATTIDGTEISLATNSAFLVIGKTTITLMRSSTSGSGTILFFVTSATMTTSPTPASLTGKTRTIASYTGMANHARAAAYEKVIGFAVLGALVI